MNPQFSSLRRWLAWLGWAAVALGLFAFSFAARCYNWPETFIADRTGAAHVYFVDGDCYARMTRVRIILDHPGTIIHHHDFENYPDGVRSHTTAPFDYAIAALKVTLDGVMAVVGRSSIYRWQTLDLAGAFISPLIGALACLYVAWWSREWSPAGRRWWLWPTLFYAVCPILDHGTALGRPDHQAPVIALLTVALTAELVLLTRGGGWRSGQWAIAEEGRQRAWCLTAGIAWGMALWMSLFEPLILLGGAFVGLLIFDRRSLFTRDRWVWEFAPLVGIVVVMLLVEGSPIPHLSPEVKQYFARWGSTVSELQHVSLLDPLIYRWLGYGSLVAVPVLVLQAQQDRRAWAVLALLLAMVGATCEYRRWGYFMGMAYALTLPWQLDWLGERMAGWNRWLQWGLVALLIAPFYPLKQEWGELLFPQGEEADHREERQRDRILLREMADNIVARSGQEVRPFLAPWWLSPALAYWTGQPGVAGSSHEGLPGIVDSARFYLAGNPEQAVAILRKRRIAWVVIDVPERIIQTSQPLLDGPLPKEPLCEVLFRSPHSGPVFLHLQGQNSYFKLFSASVAD